VWHKAAIVLVVVCLRDAARTGTSIETILVSAAASLREALTEIGNRYTQSRPGTTVRFNFASSGTLQQQIERGAPGRCFHLRRR
jgi:molybdate transport system substrate-binding protein